MTFDPQAVDIMTSDVAPSVKFRLCVGYVIDNRWYYLRKFGALSPKRAGTHSVDRDLEQFLEAARRRYDRIEVPGEITLPSFAYHPGVPVEFDDDGLPIGECPQIGKLVVTYTDKL